MKNNLSKLIEGKKVKTMVRCFRLGEDNDARGVTSEWTDYLKSDSDKNHLDCVPALVEVIDAAQRVGKVLSLVSNGKEKRCPHAFRQKVGSKIVRKCRLRQGSARNKCSLEGEKVQIANDGKSAY